MANRKPAQSWRRKSEGVMRIETRRGGKYSLSLWEVPCISHSITQDEGIQAEDSRERRMKCFVLAV